MDALLRHYLHSLNGWLTAKLNTKWGIAQVLGLWVLMAIVLAFPDYLMLGYSESYNSASCWKPRLEQFQAPLTPLAGYLSEEHGAKIAFRLTGGFMGYIVGWDSAGEVVFWLSILGLGYVVLYYYVLKAALQSALNALWLTLALVTTYGGAAGWMDVFGRLDVLAFIAIWGAMAVRKPFWVFVLVLLAAFSDERGLLATSFVVLWYAIPALLTTGAKSWQKALLLPQTIAVIVAWLMYAALRVVLMEKFGLSQTYGDVGYTVLLYNTIYAPLGLWFAMEGAWLIVLFALVLAYHHRHWLFWGLFVLAVCASAFAAYSVRDVFASMAYLMPAVAVASRYWAQFTPPAAQKKWVISAAFISVITPLYIVFGYKLYWVLPLPLYWLNYIL